eukprot:1661426-Pyramimonas_sp.AAC.1
MHEATRDLGGMTSAGKRGRTSEMMQRRATAAKKAKKVSFLQKRRNCKGIVQARGPCCRVVESLGLWATMGHIRANQSPSGQVL